MARIEVSNNNYDDFVNDTSTLTIRGLTHEELQLVADKLDELGWSLVKNDVR